jgi:UDP-glucose 4-epimerase
MRYLITGGAGFIGSHLAEELLEQGHEVLVLDNLSTGRYENLAHVDDGNRLRLIVDSVNNPEIVSECVQQVEAVFHLAAAVGVRLIIDQPVLTIESIVGGTDVVMRACARYRRPVLITSTSEVYGNGNKVPFSEEDDRVMGPTSKRRWSYACAKALDEFLSLAHWYESRLPVFIARLFNTVGPRQTGQYGMVVPRFVQQGLRGDPISVDGDGKQSRCFAHVHDVVGGLIKLLATKEARGQIFNVGNDEEITILELAERVREMTGGRSEITFVPYEEAYTEGFDDMRRRVPDLTKIKNAIGYRTTKNLSAILEDVIEFESGTKEQARPH